MFAVRSLLFRLHESPRFLAANARADEAAMILRKIAIYNEAHDFGVDFESDHLLTNGDSVTPAQSVEQADATRDPPTTPKQVSSSTPPPHARLNSSTRIPIGGGNAYAPTSPTSPTTEHRPPLSQRRSQFFTPSEELAGFEWRRAEPGSRRPSGAFTAHLPDISSEPSPIENGSDTSSDGAEKDESSPVIKGNTAIRDGLDRLKVLFTPKWRRTTTLIWIIWAAMALGEIDG